MRSTERALRVGLTGGIGSGKSTVAAMLSEHGAVVIDADELAREVVEPGTSGLEEITRSFGAEVISPDGTLNRSALAARVFSDPLSRARLEAITLPRIAALSSQRMDEVEPGGVAVYDVPLLTERAMADLFDYVIVVETPLELRLKRLEQRGLPREQAVARMASQASDEERRALADVVLVNDSDREALARGVDRLWSDTIAPAALKCGPH